MLDISTGLNVCQAIQRAPPPPACFPHQVESGRPQQLMGRCLPKWWSPCHNCPPPLDTPPAACIRWSVAAPNAVSVSLAFQVCGDAVWKEGCRGDGMWGSGGTGWDQELWEEGRGGEGRPSAIQVGMRRYGREQMQGG